MITIVDYRVGNLGSIQNMLKKVGAISRIATRPDEVASATKLILPGVGAFDAGMRNLRELGLLGPLDHAIKERRVPTLGICLGMQLMTLGSEEGSEPGLGWVPARTIRFTRGGADKLKVPHMGWNSVSPRKGSSLLGELPAEPRFYFVHSYYVRCDDPAHSLLRATYGDTEFDAGFECENVLGVQFHPEKSHRFGMALLRSFSERY